ncbi:DEAD/DEAH box helicase [Desulfopila inferna]|uniref:DEAD/DEAH box helicase n=1 Tax=Desulfopila inferna TaxID=468528 RepID=UPI0019639A4A|nr:DEAD/DEAH box helicase [Desulfopila inferna]MBM9605200.1 DEAD/DEAH box helicase [Desulfopila inferna]
MINENNSHSIQGFDCLGLDKLLLQALDKSGYTTPTPIQSELIPHLLAGCDVIGQAQTGTGKTAAFALPLLNNLILGKKAKAQVLVLAPTRELAIQVSQSFEKYGKALPGLKVVPLYGGQEYSSQLRHLKNGVHVIVGTPGRVMDHIRRGSLVLSTITSFVLDEADEMLKMGFLEDVEWILEQLPVEKNIALFSATMPGSIRRIAKTHLHNPVEITARKNTVSAPRIRQQYVITNGQRAKNIAIERILEAEQFDGMLIFVRTKVNTVELAERLASLGYSCGPLNGDIPQNQRLRMVDQLKSGKLDIVIATDVAARGLDVERISHVINYDVPFDSEAYTHRIGRTGRAGRSGNAILFLHPREKRMLPSMERETGGKISQMTLPTISDINARRIESFKDSLTASLKGDCSFFNELIEKYCLDTDIPPHQVAAALAKMMHEKTPLLLQEQPDPKPSKVSIKQGKEGSTRKKEIRRNPKDTQPESGMERYRIELGETHGVKPGNIVGAIANEADIDSRHIGRISIFDNYSTVDLPYGMPLDILRVLQKTRIFDKTMHIHKETITLPDQDQGENRNKKKKPKKTSATGKRNKGGTFHRSPQKSMAG